jgi:putative integral membrane protein (TIGR02587 family)
LGVIGTGGSFPETVGKISLQAVPGSIGALLAQAQLGQRDTDEEPKRRAPVYGAELFIMGVGALFLAFNIAPTEEIVLIALQMTAQQALVMLALSLALMHAFVYSVSFQGAPEDPQNAAPWSLFLRFTVAGYALSLLLGAFVLWVFGTLDGMAALPAAQAVIVLGFPAGIGAAAARLIL